MKDAFLMMLNFFGMRLNSTQTEVKHSKNFEERYKNLKE
jgi:hypothetical protein